MGIPSLALLTADAPGVLSLFPPRWGIFQQSGAPALVADSVASVDYSREYDVSDYPQERGAFESYNKVQQPFDSKVTLLSSLTRQQLLNILEPTVASLALVSVVTPEVSYPSANLTRYSLRRTQRNGVTLVAVDVWCKEIRVTATTAIAGTNYPVGQLAPGGGANLAPGTTSSASPTDLPPGTAVQQTSSGSGNVDLATGSGQFFVPSSSALDTGSTNAATATSSGPVQATAPIQQGSPDFGSINTNTIGVGGPLAPPT